MCANRVEELESRVQKLEASVEGLTDELVECKVRLRELENAIDEDLGFAPVTDDLDGFPEPVENGESPEEAGDSADTTNSEGTEEPDTPEDAESGDIIVA